MLQFLNAYFPIVFKLSGRLKYFKFVQFKKHSSEIVSNISGNITSESELHPAKSFLLSSFILPKKTISFKDSQLENASLSTLDILSGR